MEEIQDYKWHITCEGHCKVKNSIAYIKTVREKSVLKRHILKSVSWRLIGTIDTMILGWIVTGDIKLGLAIGGFEVITKMILYFLHERIWYRHIKFGVTKVEDTIKPDLRIMESMSTGGDSTVTTTGPKRLVYTKKAG